MTNRNGVRSRPFCVKNGVRQGGIASPVLFCVHFDGLLQMLRESNVGCFVGNMYVGALAYTQMILLY